MKVIVMQHRLALVFLLTLIGWSGVGSGATLTVRRDGTGDFGVIQGALDAAAPGDTIMIGPGEYLEETVFHDPDIGYAMRSYANVTVDNLTIIGAGVGLTVLGPPFYSPDEGTGSPKGISVGTAMDIHVEGLTIRNCTISIWGGGRLFVDQCEFVTFGVGILWVSTGTGGAIRNSTFIGINWMISSSVILLGPGTGVVMENCVIVEAITDSRLADIRFVGCEFLDTGEGLSLYGSASHTVVEKCNINASVVGVVQNRVGGNCEIRNSVVSGGRLALKTGTGGRFVVENSVLQGGTDAVLRLYRDSGLCTIFRSDIIRGSGAAVVCEPVVNPIIHDLRGNYWGTAIGDSIAASIWDRNDDPSLLATINYVPFVGQSVPAEATTWGSVKALFR